LRSQKRVFEGNFPRGQFSGGNIPEIRKENAYVTKRLLVLQFSPTKPLWLYMVVYYDVYQGGNLDLKIERITANDQLNSQYAINFLG